MDPPKTSNQRQKKEEQVVEAKAARKVQKADREKLRRDRLNDHFLDLTRVLEPGSGPKNDKARILTETLQVLKDLSAEVNRLKSEGAVLSEESREQTQEKEELSEEKATLKSDVYSLSVQYQQSLNVMVPWATAFNPSVVVGPAYSYAVPVPIPSGTIPLHPAVQPFPFFRSQNPGSNAIPGSTLFPYPAPPNPSNDCQSVHFASASHVSTEQESRSRSATNHQRGSISNTERCGESDDVATELELKTPGLSAQKDVSSGEGKCNQSNGSSSTKYSSSQSLQHSSSNSVKNIRKCNN